MKLMARPTTIIKSIDCELAKSKTLAAMRRELYKSEISPCFNEDDFARCTDKLRESLKKVYAQNKLQAA